MKNEVQVQRLVLFCPEVDLDVERLRKALQDLGEEHGLEGLELQEVRAPEDLPEGRWTAVLIRPMRGVGADALNLGEHVEAVTKAIAQAAREPVLGVFAAPAQKARAAFASTTGHPRMAQGELTHVLRQAAAWIHADPETLLQFFEEHAPSQGAKNVPVEEIVPDEPDEDDRYVEAKLKQARELMQQYISTRK